MFVGYYSPMPGDRGSNKQPWQSIEVQLRLLLKDVPLDSWVAYDPAAATLVCPRRLSAVFFGSMLAGSLTGDEAARSMPAICQARLSSGSKLSFVSGSQTPEMILPASRQSFLVFRAESGTVGT